MVTSVAEVVETSDSVVVAFVTVVVVVVVVAVVVVVVVVSAGFGVLPFGSVPPTSSPPA